MSSSYLPCEYTNFMISLEILIIFSTYDKGAYFMKKYFVSVKHKE